MVDPAKVQAMVEWSQLKAVTKIRSFLGLADYYRRFVKKLFFGSTAYDDCPYADSSK